MKVEKNLLYSKDHEWVKVDGKKAYIGISDYAQHALGDIVYVELPEVDDEVSQGDVFGTIESVKAASDALIPVSGKVTEINEDLVDDPALLNSNPYENWMVCMELNDESELKGLMKAEEYEEIISKEA